MSVRTSDLSTGLVAGLLAVAYAVFAHYTSAAADITRWTLVLACAPMAVAGAGYARESRLGLVLFLAGLAVVAFLAWIWPTLRNPASWLYFLQHIAINGVLGLLFGRTLIGARRPLCTTLAGLVHERVSPMLAGYTRRVTVAWTSFFALTVALSALLFFLAPIEAWSVFANLLTLPLVAAMFIVENAVGRHVLPPEDHVQVQAVVRAFRTAFRP